MSIPFRSYLLGTESPLNCNLEIQMKSAGAYVFFKLCMHLELSAYLFKICLCA